MPVFFVFSDEAGSYRQNRSEKFLKAHPFYVRASLIISADDWIRLNSKYLKIKGEYAIPKDKEFKWSFIWLSLPTLFDRRFLRLFDREGE